MIRLSKTKLQLSEESQRRSEDGTADTFAAYKWSWLYSYILGVCKLAIEWMKSMKEWVFRGKINLFSYLIKQYHAPFHSIFYWVSQHHFPHTAFELQKVPITTTVLWSYYANKCDQESSLFECMYEKSTSLPIFCSSSTKMHAWLTCFVRLNL